MNPFEFYFFSFAFITAFLAAIFFVIFGQITVRKLRKNPQTKEQLGIELASGWDILNVASALALPRWLNKKYKNSSLSFLYADAEILDRYTTRFDRVLARIFYSLFVFSGSSLIILLLLDQIGIFE